MHLSRVPQDFFLHSGELQNGLSLVSFQKGKTLHHPPS